MTLKYLNKDFSAGLAVFLVTLPLCLGIALASGAPLFSGLLAGVVGGMVVTLFSGSEVTISGPAAGLTIIVFDSIQRLGSYPNFLMAVVLAGIIQFLLGWLKAGRLSSFVPSSVISGMLVAIGIVIVLKQIPHALGWDADYEGEFEFSQADHRNTFSEILEALNHPAMGAIIISVICLGLIIWWSYLERRGIQFFKTIPGGVVVVLAGVLLNQAFRLWIPELSLKESSHMVRVPIIRDWEDAKAAFNFPALEILTNSQVYISALTLAIVGSIESLFSLEAADKLDLQRRISSPNQELKAQGIGNIVSGLIGGLPLTVVTIRTSVNIYSGSKTRLSSFIHGLLMLLAVIAIPRWLNYIPLACLAALLIFVGYRLAKIAVFKKMYQEGLNQFIPFIITVIAIVFTDLLIGLTIGLVVGMAYVVYTNNLSAISVGRDKETVLIWFKKDVSFLNKAHLKEVLASLKSGDYVFVDGVRAHFIDHDIYTTLEEFQEDAPLRGIQVEFKGITRRKISNRKSNASIQKTLISE
ncbi:SulP family inorganic anion transporter [Runella sp.]|uniref:SulP family inorganic anion transporter n=1 Tax=Runella sp. TaxID=1960881 RepID=UPI003D100856